MTNKEIVKALKDLRNEMKVTKLCVQQYMSDDLTTIDNLLKELNND